MFKDLYFIYKKKKKKKKGQSQDELVLMSCGLKSTPGIQV